MTWAPDYVTIEALKHYLRIPTAEAPEEEPLDALDDLELALAISTASRSIDRASNRQFGQVAEIEARFYTAHRDGDGRLRVTIDDLQEPEDMVVELDVADDLTYATAVATWRLLPLNVLAEGRPYTSIELPAGVVAPRARGAVKVTACWGWAAIPSTIQNAALIQASRLMKRRDAPFGVAGSPELGNELRLLEKLDPDVAVMVADYRRWWGAA